MIPNLYVESGIAAVTRTHENMSMIVSICELLRSSYCAMSATELFPLKYLRREHKVSMSVLFLCCVHLSTDACSSSENSFKSSNLTSVGLVGEGVVGMSGEEMGVSSEGKRNT